MADSPSAQRPRRGHLDASGSREVVYCYGCHNEWWKDDYGLRCPGCHGEATQIVSAEDDPRAMADSIVEPNQPQNQPPWAGGDVPDPEEGNVEEYISHSPSGRTTYFQQTFTTHRPIRPSPGVDGAALDPEDPSNVIIRDFQNMIGQFMGPTLRQGPAGVSGPDVLFPRGEPEPFRRRTFGGGLMADGGSHGPQVIGHRFTFTSSSGGRPRDPEVQDVAAEDFATIVGGLFGPSSPIGQLHNHNGDPNVQRGNLPPGLPGFFASLLNPANAVAGDTVYSQEALDRIISTLMEQHPQSNAPGPASPEAIASLPKKRIDEKMMGPELKAECSVCMDDVHLGDEVVVLPCKHWFHETCASAWLGEHNTCPICRTSIGGDSPPLNPRRSSQNVPSPPPTHESRSRDYRRHSMNIRQSPTNDARLSTIRDWGRLPPMSESGGGGANASLPRRYTIIGDPGRLETRSPSPSPVLEGYFSSRRRDSMINERQRETRRDSRIDLGRNTSGNTSGSERSSARSSNSANTRESTGSRPMSWFRRFSGRSSGRRPE